MRIIVPQQATPAAADALGLCRRIAALGLRPRVYRHGQHIVAGGITRRLSIADALAATPDKIETLEGQLGPLRAALRLGTPVTVSIRNLGCDAPGALLQAFCERLRGFLDLTPAFLRRLGLCISASEISLGDFRRITHLALGDGPRYILPGGRQRDIDRPDARIDAAWRALHAAQTGPGPLWPACHVGVRSYCPLLGGETSSVLVPDGGVAAPPDSAWLPIDLDICRFAAPNGSVCQGALDQALDACIELGDRLFDGIEWFDERQRRDARMNRRLAIQLCGLGDLVVLRGHDPADLDCLRSLDHLVGRIHDGLWRRSRRLAEIKGPLPALAEKQPNGVWRDEAHRRDWELRWRRALDDAQVRHRNLLVLSPYSVLPRSTDASPDYADLLPVIAHADALAFADPPPIGWWNVHDFRHFHQRTLALVGRLNAASFIAAGV